jgi:hypothetical protein
MLADRIQEWGEEFKREGLAKGHQQGLLKGLEEGLEKGLEEGLQKGLQEGEARLLIRQLQKRFGALPESVHVRVSQAPPERLELWGERLLDVASLDALFDGEGCPAVGSP